MLFRSDQLYREAFAADAAKALAPTTETPREMKTGKTFAPAGKVLSGKASNPDKSSCTPSGKRASSERRVPIEDVLESSASGSKRSKPAPPETKKVPVREDGTGGAFTISSTLESK